ncbi:LysE family translocator [Paracoccus suum]|uniref:LysE family translocator n=1 Tax=Paracoccus suum TaxID=2259340 RepID=A0A344PI51_9RHOB|nr:LysE family translocator [Paracoccus suum]AXC49056.1 LysE family translocator [Paracoccus suum]
MIVDTILAIPTAQLALFITSGLALNVAPGQDVMFASACGIRGGVRAGMLAGFGVGLGVLCHVAMATLGLGALLAAHPGAQTAVRLVGAGYLLWLAWKSWRAPPADEVSLRNAPPARATALIGRGALSNLLNPKPVLFLLSFLPQFTNPAWGPVWQQVLGLGLIFAFTGTLVTMAYGALAGLAREGLARRLGWVNRLAAVMFAGLALRLVLR